MSFFYCCIVLQVEDCINNSTSVMSQFLGSLYSIPSPVTSTHSPSEFGNNFANMRSYFEMVIGSGRLCLKHNKIMCVGAEEIHLVRVVIVMNVFRKFKSCEIS